MRGFIPLALAVVACLGLLAAPCDACPAQVQQLQGFANPCAQAYVAPVQQFVAPPPAAYYVAPPVQQFIAPQVMSYSAPVAAVKVAAVNVGYGYGSAAVVGAPVALRGRFAGSPAVAGVAQLNVGVAKSRERVLRPTLFKRAVAAPVVGAAPLVVPY